MGTGVHEVVVLCPGLVIRAQHAKTGKVSVLKIKKGTKMASVFEAHAKHKGLKTQSLSVMKQRQQQQQQQQQNRA